MSAKGSESCAPLSPFPRPGSQRLWDMGGRGLIGYWQREVTAADAKETGVSGSGAGKLGGWKLMGVKKVIGTRISDPC